MQCLYFGLVRTGRSSATLGYCDYYVATFGELRLRN